MACIRLQKCCYNERSRVVSQKRVLLYMSMYMYIALYTCTCIYLDLFLNSGLNASLVRGFKFRSRYIVAQLFSS